MSEENGRYVAVGRRDEGYRVFVRPLLTNDEVGQLEALDILTSTDVVQLDSTLPATSIEAGKEVKPAQDFALSVAQFIRLYGEGGREVVHIHPGPVELKAPGDIPFYILK